MPATLGVIVWTIAGFLLYRGIAADASSDSGIHDVYAIICFASAAVCFSLGSILLTMQLVLGQMAAAQAHNRNDEQ